ncbi:MAG: hypothetical protein JNK24_00545 [Alphaproteobacteria bacterium]|nr:hypothetical protein [Alphaproteobacteria bacterium]
MKKIIRQSALSVSCLAILTFAPPSFAAIDAAGAESLKTMYKNIESGINIYFTGRQELKSVGDLSVTPKDYYYEVVTPYYYLQLDTHSVLDIGKIAINVIPDENGEDYKISYSLPPTMTFKSDGKALGTLTIGTQKTNVIWNDKLKFATFYDQSFEDFALKADNQTLASLKKITGMRSLKTDGPKGKLNGETHFSFQDFSAGTNNAVSVKIAQADISSVSKNLDMAKILDLQAKVEEFKKSGQWKKLNAEPADPQAVKEYLEILVTIFEGDMGEAQGDMKFKNIVLKEKAKSPVDTAGAAQATGETSANPSPNPSSVEIGELTLGGGVSSQGHNKNKIDLRVGVAGVKIDGIDPASQDIPKELQAFLPQKFTFNVGLENFPYSDFLKIIPEQVLHQTQTQAALANGAEVPSHRLSPADQEQFKALLVSSGAKITNQLVVENGMYKVDGKGMSQFISGPIPIKTDQDFTVTGLDKVLAEMNKLAATYPQVQQALGGITMMQMMGQADPAHPDVRRYHFITDENGKATLNGSDLSSLMGGRH